MKPNETFTNQITVYLMKKIDQEKRKHCMHKNQKIKQKLGVFMVWILTYSRY